VRGPASDSRGFVLVAVLILLVVLALLATGVATTAERAVREAANDQERFHAELDMVSTQETLLVMLSTHRRTIAGLRPHYAAAAIATGELDENPTDWLPAGDEIRMDGRTYAGLGHIHFALQDDRGQLSVNWAPVAIRHAAYAALGAPVEQWARLDDIRLDYQDDDDLRRLDGAEADEYRALGLPPPANRPLTSPLELRQLPEWRELLTPLDDEAVLRRFSVTREVSVNLNTAPVDVLAALPGMDRVNAERLVALRELAPIASIAAAQREVPLNPALEEFFNLYANSHGHLIVWDSRQGIRRMARWTLMTLGNTRRPWRIDYEVILPRGDSDDQLAAEPTQAALFAKEDPDRG
jgi:general secretion pathway protein K